MQALQAQTQAQMQALQAQIQTQLQSLLAQSAVADPWFRPPTVEQGAAVQEGIPCPAANSHGQWIPPGIPISWEPNGQQSKYSPDMRHWKEQQLDLNVKPENFKTWQLRAVRMLSEDRPDVQRLLEWAEAQTTSIDTAASQVGARTVGLQRCEDVQAISMKMLNLLTSMLANSLIAMTQACGVTALSYGVPSQPDGKAKANRFWPKS